MKLTDLVAEFLARQGINTIFVVSGGASLHLIHSIAENPQTNFVCPQHEQGGAYAADSYARVTGNMGCAVATSGPGATNLITGIATSYYDSVPVLYLTGQVATFRSKGLTGVRQIGFQETDIVDICRTITKYAVLITDPYDVLYELQKAVFLAKQGRPGPVLVDLPDDLQRMDIDEQKMKIFYPPVDQSVEKHNKISDIDINIEAFIHELKHCERPVIIYGWGIHLSGAENEAISVAQKLGIPIATTWGARDLLDDDNPLSIGGFGTHGTRFANFAVQNADLILSVGSRLDTKATGTPPSSFARSAKIFMVDIDRTEIDKFKKLNKNIDFPIISDAKLFLNRLHNKIGADPYNDFSNWINRIYQWKMKYPQILPEHERQKSVNPYWLIKQLSSQLNNDDIIISDTGCAIAWLMQAFEFKTGQRFFHAFNNTPMGYALPAAIGACCAKPDKRIICIVGDGGLLMSMQEMATVIYHQYPIKLILLNNRGHGMVRQTQEMWLDSNYYATSAEGGLPTPDFTSISKAFGFHTLELKMNEEVCIALNDFIKHKGPSFLNVELDNNEQVIPQVKFGRPNEDAGPLLDRSEFLENMLIPPLETSLK